MQILLILIQIQCPWLNGCLAWTKTGRWNPSCMYICACPHAFIFYSKFSTTQYGLFVWLCLDWVLTASSYFVQILRMLLEVQTCIWAFMYRGKCCMLICIEPLASSVLAILYEAMPNTSLDNGSTKYKTDSVQLH